MQHNEATRALFITGLRNAHAMENQALSVIDAQLGRLESYPEMIAMLQQHRRETEGQIARLDQIFLGLGESASTLKDTVLSAMGSMQAMGHALAGDEILKNHMADYMFEHFEIAAYTSLITMAQAMGHTSALPLLQQNLDEEQRFQQMLIESLPRVTEQFLSRIASGQKADV
ncbi:MAG: ferritin-like domain-containing protein [Tabrizicola sp.]|uniref:ferritin-like domain-containing protein n=1 Tax=Tabrizicola sp. TaxID=2005166 RepID=UPI002ABBE97E|nr:ferritin-like domain-containing protein [Tabrizicola sp.]MDZ4089277.1 ferritin-like domain-containing protein [Tabrizicola sp.]